MRLAPELIAGLGQTETPADQLGRKNSSTETKADQDGKRSSNTESKPVDPLPATMPGGETKTNGATILTNPAVIDNDSNIMLMEGPGPDLEKLGPPRSAKELRNSPGKVTGGYGLPDIEGDWLKGTDGSYGIVPGQVAKALQGRDFKNFDAFRGAFWEAVAADEKLAALFDPISQAQMRKGQAPFADVSQANGSQAVMQLHHKTPIQHGGPVYDLDNIAVVSPNFHQAILDGKYHYGSRKP